MEWWNVGLLKDIIFFIKMNLPLNHHTKTHCSIIPVFQHSNWGEAPEFFFSSTLHRRQS